MLTTLGITDATWLVLACLLAFALVCRRRWREMRRERAGWRCDPDVERARRDE